jgi:hypothetical protein
MTRVKIKNEMRICSLEQNAQNIRVIKCFERLKVFGYGIASNLGQFATGLIMSLKCHLAWDNHWLLARRCALALGAVPKRYDWIVIVRTQRNPCSAA